MMMNQLSVFKRLGFFALATFAMSSNTLSAISYTAGSSTVDISGTSPSTVSDITNTNSPCYIGNSFGNLYIQSCVEPNIAANNGKLFAVWHQDRWSSGGALGLGGAYSTDGGATWNRVFPPFTLCRGGTSGIGQFERASDPWASFDKTGNLYWSGLSFTYGPSAVINNVPGGVAVGVLPFGGSFSSSSFQSLVPVTIQTSKGVSTQVDKDSITADYTRDNTAYVVWNNYLGTPIGASVNTKVKPPVADAFQNRTQFSMTSDGGKSWSSPKEIINVKSINAKNGYNSPEAETNFPTTVVFPTGHLGVSFASQGFDKQNITHFPIYFISSSNQGKTWSNPVKVTDINYTPTADNALLPNIATPASIHQDPTQPRLIRSANQLPLPGVNKTNGWVYVVWSDFPDGDATAAAQYAPNVYISLSKDEGQTWSAKKLISRGVGAGTYLTNRAFDQNVVVNDRGDVAVFFYDFTNYQTTDVTSMNDNYSNCDAWVAILDGNLNNFIDNTGNSSTTPYYFRLTSSSFIAENGVFSKFFNLPPGTNLGDYIGLTNNGNDFVAAFMVTNSATTGTNQPKFDQPNGTDPNQVTVGGASYETVQRSKIVFNKVSFSP